MMGRQPANQGKLFYYDISLERRIPAKHLLRQIKEAVNFAFVYEEVQDCYGVNGNVSIPPPVIVKLMLLLFLYDVRSERELRRCRTVWIGYGSASTTSTARSPITAF